MLTTTVDPNSATACGIIYTPDPSDLDAIDRCMRHLQGHGYRLVGIVTEWAAVERMLARDAVSAVVVDRRADIPLDPRVTILAESPPGHVRSRPARTARLAAMESIQTPRA